MKTKVNIHYVLLLLFAISTGFAQKEVNNKLNLQGKKEGLWKGFYLESKRLRYEGTFENGKEVGLFTFYDDTKEQSIIATRQFNVKDASAYTIFYDQKKNVVSEGKIVNKLFEGLWKYYHHESKNIMTTENYKNGKLEGARKVFFPDGTIAEETYYKNGVKEGLCKMFSEKGIVLEETNYKNNLYHGLAIFKNTKGEIVSKGNFVNGKKQGIWQFFKDNKLENEVNMSNPEAVAKYKPYKM